MKRRFVIVEPSTACPFRVEGLQYIPERSHDDGLTLVLLHAVNLHKETFDVMLTHLLESDRPGSLKFKDAWCIGDFGSYLLSLDCLNHYFLR